MKLLELENFLLAKKLVAEIYIRVRMKRNFYFGSNFAETKSWNVRVGRKHFPGLDSAIKIFIQPLENGIVVCKSKIVPRRLRHFQGQTSAASPFTATSRRLFN